MDAVDTGNEKILFFLPVDAGHDNAIWYSISSCNRLEGTEDVAAFMASPELN